MIKLFFRLFKVIIYIFLFISILFMFYHANGVYSSAQKQDLSKSDAIIVLGAAQFNGTPSPVFQARLDHSIELYEKSIAPIIITVGGKQEGDKFTEAQAGKNYLKNKIKSSKIKAITDGKDTLESFELIRKKYPELVKVTLVSDPAHLWRSKLMANDLNFQVQLSGTTQGPGSKLTREYFIREYVASMRYQFMHYFPSQWQLLKSLLQ